MNMETSQNQHNINITVNESGYIWVVLPDSILPINDYDIEQKISKKITGSNDHLVIDLKETTYIYSVLMGVISRLLKKVIIGGGELYIVNANDKCSEILCMLKLDTIIPIFTKSGELVDGLKHHKKRRKLSLENQKKIQNYIATGKF